MYTRTATVVFIHITGAAFSEGGVKSKNALVKMARYIQSLEVEKYRGLHDICVNELNDINLIMGCNNCGKTSLLELISTIQAPGCLGAWRTCARLNPAFNTTNTIFNGFCSMFSPDDDKFIAYSFLDQEAKLHKIRINAKIQDAQYLPEEKRHLIPSP